MGQTIKQNNRSRYTDLCRRYTTAMADILDTRPISKVSEESTQQFIQLSVELHAAKGWEGIPKSWTTAAAVRRFGTC